ncbi:MAG: hypothetical protein ACJ8GN_04945 [Longimicrobiaceae bacterium]
MHRSNRDNFSPRVRDTLAKRVGYACSRPECPKLTAGPHDDPETALVLGRAAHITAAAPGGPRYDPTLSPQQRGGLSNGIWLCVACADLIDANAPRYPVSLLREWKQEAEARVRLALEAGAWPAAPAPSPPPVLPPLEDVFHPHTLRRLFTGRMRQRRSLTQWWMDGGAPVRVLVGMGGMGKSSLAWVWKCADVLGLPVPGQLSPVDAEPPSGVPRGERPDGVLWWSFYAPELQIQNSFSLFVDRALNYVGRGAATASARASLDDRIDALLGHLRSGRFLLVLDGFERATRLYYRLTAPYDADLGEDEPPLELRRCTDERAGRFLCEAAAGGRSRVLLTSRVYPCELDGVAGVERHDLEALEPVEALRLFRSHGVRGSDADILEACRDAGHHPLAVRLLIGHVLNAGGEHRGHVYALPAAPAIIDLRPEDRRRHVFEIAYGGLDAKARELFGRIAIFTQPVPYQALQVCSPYAGKATFARAVDELEQRGFLTYDAERSLYDMHPLVRQYAYAHLDSKERREGARKAYGYLAERLPDHELTLVTLGLNFEVYRQAIQAGLLEEANDIYLYRLHTILFFRVARYQDQVAVLQELITAARQESGRLSDDALGALMHHLSTACNLVGRPSDGLRWAVEAETLLARGDTEQRFRPNRLVYTASSAMRTGRLRLSAEALTESVSSFASNSDVFHEAIARMNLAWVLTYLGQFDEAQEHLNHAAAAFTHPKTLHWKCIIAIHRVRLELLSGEIETALAHAREAKEIAEELGGEGNIVRAAWALGASLVRCAVAGAGPRDSLLVEAESCLSGALKRCVGSGFGDFELEVRVALAELHRASENAAEARRQAQAALTLAESGGHLLKQAEAHLLLATLAEEASEQASALEHARRALECSGSDDPAFSLSWIANGARERILRLGGTSKEWRLSPLPELRERSPEPAGGSGLERMGLVGLEPTT